MEEKIIYARPNPTSATRPVVFDPEICTGCNKCVNVCQTDVFIPNPEKGNPPIILHPDECWYCGPCVDACTKDGAITLNYPLMWRVPWKRKGSDKHYWYGMKNPPPPNTKPMP
ncbi:MAG: ferredoxin family protein [Chloroflexi bacterium]|jgi:NAD-dependent dihydropyrimidine dehydrogenase PreA subunit|nr:ferredoxin family protein [Chloroflexota bacterium]MBT7082530.1 ferredoxin family protein [Chloroflexota bacterium]MBT7290311.1 ferredoxin family protein [Chloroflexota bacterium]